MQETQDGFYGIFPAIAITIDVGDFTCFVFHGVGRSVIEPLRHLHTIRLLWRSLPSP